MELTVENFQKARKICIWAVLEVMKTLVPNTALSFKNVLRIQRM